MQHWTISRFSQKTLPSKYVISQQAPQKLCYRYTLASGSIPFPRFKGMDSIPIGQRLVTAFWRQGKENPTKGFKGIPIP